MFKYPPREWGMRLFNDALGRLPIQRRGIHIVISISGQY